MKPSAHRIKVTKIAIAIAAVSFLGLFVFMSVSTPLENKIRSERQSFRFSSRTPNLEQKIETALDEFEAADDHTPVIIDVSVYKRANDYIGLNIHWLAKAPVVAGYSLKPISNYKVTAFFTDIESVNQYADETVYFSGSSMTLRDTDKATHPLALALVDEDGELLTDYQPIRILNPKPTTVDSE